MFKNLRTLALFTCFLLTAAVFPMLVAAAAPQPTNASGDVVVWTINTGNNSVKNCSTIGGCNTDLFSKRAQTLAECPDIVLAQEIRTREHVVALREELDEIGGACGVYRHYFYDQNPSDPSDTEIAKVALAWRFDRFELAKTSSGDWDVLNHREMWNEVNGSDASCPSFQTHHKDGTPGGPSAHVTAVRLLDKVRSGKSLVAAAVHWDGAMSIECLQENIRVLDEDMSSRWSGLPTIMGGDHNRKARPQKKDAPDWTVSRTEVDPAPWHDFVTGRGYTDVIRATYSTTSDENGDGNIDMCEQYTSGIHLDHAKTVSNVCSHVKHGRIDYIWIKNVAALVDATTDKAHYGRHRRGNYYSDHRPVYARVSY